MKCIVNNCEKYGEVQEYEFAECSERVNITVTCYICESHLGLLSYPDTHFGLVKVNGQEIII